MKLPVLVWLLVLLPLGCREAPRGLVVANGDDVSLLHPQRTASVADARVLQAMHAGLTRLDPRTLAPEPGLASHFEQADGGRVWRFWLRAGLRWSDGAELTRDDVLRSWRAVADPLQGSPWSSWLSDATFHTFDARGLEVRFPEPRPAFGEMAAFPALAPVPAHARVEEVGSGPFRLVTRRVRDRIVVERNPHYWDAQSVELEAIDFLTVESQVTALNLFLAGDIAYAPNAPELAVPALRERMPEAFQPTPQFATTFLRFQVQDSPFDDLELRRAVAASIDVDALQRALGGVRIASSHFVPVDTPGWIPARLPTWRKKKADTATRARLAELHLDYLYNSSELNRSVAEVLQAQWRHGLGIEVGLVNQEWKSFLAAQRGLDYQVSRSSWIGDYLDPLSFLEIFHSESGNSRTGWKDAMFDGLIEQARREQNEEARRLLLQEAERRLLDQAVIVPLYQEVGLELIDPRLEGLERNLRGYVDWGRVRWKEDARP